MRSLSSGRASRGPVGMPRNDEQRNYPLLRMHRSDVFLTCQIPGLGGASLPPTQSRAELQIRRRRWDKTSEVPEVHGALRCWARSKAEKPHYLRLFWRVPAPFLTQAA